MSHGLCIMYRPEKLLNKDDLFDQGTDKTKSKARIKDTCE